MKLDYFEIWRLISDYLSAVDCQVCDQETKFAVFEFRYLLCRFQIVQFALQVASCELPLGRFLVKKPDPFFGARLLVFEILGFGKILKRFRFFVVKKRSQTKTHIGISGLLLQISFLQS